MLEIVFWTLVVLVGYVYFGYPALLLLLSRGARKDPVYDEVKQPSVTLIISAFNEADCIAEKLENSLQLDYPKELLEIVAISDASDDGTDEIVSSYADRGIRLLRMEERGGKTLGLNAGVEEANGEVIVFSDANAMYLPDAIKTLVAPYADEEIGAVIGESTYVEPDSDSGRSESLYWRYETAIKRYESALGSVVGGDGAIYSVRRELYRPMTADALSDFINPLQVVEQGRRCIYESRAISVEEVAGSFDKEFRRKVRIVNRGWRAVISMKRLMNPLKYGLFAFELVSHKLLRWLVPLFLALILLTNIVILGKGFIYLFAFAAQIVFYTSALAGALIRKRGDLHLAIYVPYYFCLVNFASARGIMEAYVGKTYTTWSTARE
jgi:cellulose synthase/poly-beta-1,6-N-acetylglucosamine synthase-like glycosyltransferase